MLRGPLGASFGTLPRLGSFDRYRSILVLISSDNWFEDRASGLEGRPHATEAPYSSLW